MAPVFAARALTLKNEVRIFVDDRGTGVPAVTVAFLKSLIPSVRDMMISFDVLMEEAQLPELQP